MSWFVSATFINFWAGVLLYPACLTYLGIVIFVLENSGGYTGSRPLIVGGYFVIAAADFVLSYIYSSDA